MLVKGNNQQAIQTARVWQILGELNLIDSIFNHVSVVSKSHDEKFIMSMNPEGLLPFETLLDTIRIFPLKEYNLKDARYLGVNPDGLYLHSYIHFCRKKPGAIIHLHSPYSIAVGNTRQGLLPLSQTSIEFWNDIITVEYSGLFRSGDLDENLRFFVQKGGVVLLRNHGLLSVADTVEEAFYLSYYLEEACRIQCLTLSQNTEIVMPKDHQITIETSQNMKSDRPELALKLFDAFCRKYKI